MVGRQVQVSLPLLVFHITTLFLLVVVHVACLTPRSGSDGGSSTRTSSSRTGRVIRPTSNSQSSHEVTIQPPTPPAVVVISTNKNGGHTKRFTFNHGFHEQQQNKQQIQQQTPPSPTEKKQQGRALDLSRSVQRRLGSMYGTTASILRSTFLPTGYPSKTPRGYLRFSIWSVIQDLSTQLRSVLATQRILEGVGVGRVDATSLSALLNFLIRDASGMIATLLFTASSASKFRSDVKRWRIFADIMVDIGITLEVAAVSLPSAYFLPMICLGNVCKAICGVSAGSVGGSINLFWTTGGGSDISDINAKFGSQRTVSSMIGIVASALFAKSVATKVHSTLNLYILYGLLTALHIYANLKCMRLIAFPTFNTVRLNMVLDYFLDHWSQGKVLPVPTPQAVAQYEPLLFPLFNHKAWSKPFFRKKATIPILFGVSFNEFTKKSGSTSQQLKESVLQLSSNSTDYYLISSGLTSVNRRGKPCVLVSLGENCSSETEIGAYFHAKLLTRTLREVTEQHRRQKQQQQQQQKEKKQANKQQQIQPGTAVATASTTTTTAASSVQRKAFFLDEWNKQRWVAESVAVNEMPMVWNTFKMNCRKSGWDLSAPSELHTNGYEIKVSRRKNI